MVKNCQVQHQSIVFETSGTITDQNFSILIDPDATEIFIYSAFINRINLNKVEKDDFRYV
jgi:hypothetical protein